MRQLKKTVVHFTHDGVEYSDFDSTHPYFVVREGRIESCHERYAPAYAIAGYSGDSSAGKKGVRTAIVTSVTGLRGLGIRNPVPEAKP